MSPDMCLPSRSISTMHQEQEGPSLTESHSCTGRGPGVEGASHPLAGSRSLTRQPHSPAEKPTSLLGSSPRAPGTSPRANALLHCSDCNCSLSNPGAGTGAADLTETQLGYLPLLVDPPEPRPGAAALSIPRYVGARAVPTPSPRTPSLTLSMLTPPLMPRMPWKAFRPGKTSPVRLERGISGAEHVEEPLEDASQRG